MEITQNINLDFGRSSMPPTVFAKQGDNDTRKLVITPLNNGEAYTIGNGITARFHMTKPDKHVVIDNATISSGKIEFILTGQCLAAHGTGVAEIGLYNNDELLTTQIFYIEIEKSAYDQDAPESTDELNSLADYVRKERKIAGIDLQDDITADEMKTALGIGDKMDKAFDENDPDEWASIPAGQLYVGQGRPMLKKANGYYAFALFSEIPTVPTKVSDLSNDAGYIPVYNASSAPPSSATTSFYPAPCLWVYYDDQEDTTQTWFVYSRSEVTIPGSPSQYYYSYVEIGGADLTGVMLLANTTNAVPAASGGNAPDYSSTAFGNLAVGQMFRCTLGTGLNTYQSFWIKTTSNSAWRIASQSDLDTLSDLVGNANDLLEAALNYQS
jgi:hypothetical protein